MKKVKFSVIPQRIKMQGIYRIDVAWDYMEDSLNRYKKQYNLELNSDFQRGHVWSRTQQIKYVEFILSGGITGKDIYFNYPNWQCHCNENDTMVCVDGLQRLTAAQKFMENEFKVFDKYYAKNFIRLDSRCGFKFNINDLTDKKDILRWYLEMNSGGTPHSKKEIKKVQSMLDREER